MELSRRALEVLGTIIRHGRLEAVVVYEGRQSEIAQELFGYRTRQALAQYLKELRGLGLIRTGRGFIEVTQKGLEIYGDSKKLVFVLVKARIDKIDEILKALRSRGLLAFKVTGDRDIVVITEISKIDVIHSIPGVEDTVSLVAIRKSRGSLLFNRPDISGMSEAREYRYLVRIYDQDVEGRIPLKIALTKILGIGRPMALRILRAAGMDPNMRAGYLTDEEIEKLVSIMKDPKAYGIPTRSLNRQRDPATGEDVHMLSTDRFIQVRRDIENMIKIRSRKGIRHARGLKVRGQRTKTAAKRTDPRVGLVAKKKEEKKKRRRRRGLWGIRRGKGRSGVGRGIPGGAIGSSRRPNSRANTA